METKNILYIHGMGGGGDSRIPSILAQHIDDYIPDGAGYRIRIVVRTYDFDPAVAQGQIASWVEEVQPVMIVGESLGALNALRIKGLPHIFVSPSLNAPLYFANLAFLSLIPGVRPLLNRIYRPKEGDRQKLDFSFRTMRNYKEHRKAALKCVAENAAQKNPASYFAFFGESDHYRRSGIVSIRTWRKYFGEGTYATYPGTHFMEEEFVLSMLMRQILKQVQDDSSGVQDDSES